VVSRRAPRSFFAVSARALARRLIGTRLVRVLPDGTRLAGIIVETEAYVGVRDRASHAYNARRTERNEAMYAHPGTSYVYFTYGMHFCMNIACDRVNDPQAVLLRALDPVEGLDAMRELRLATRRADRRIRDHELCRGPGNLCKALGIDRAMNFLDMTDDRSLFIELANSPTGAAPIRVVRTPRIGLGPKADGEWADALLRYVVDGIPHVTPSPRQSRQRAKSVQAPRSTSTKPDGRARREPEVHPRGKPSQTKAGLLRTQAR
jgi:DNA-3-methyladenine glycosylase